MKLTREMVVIGFGIALMYFQGCGGITSSSPSSSPSPSSGTAAIAVALSSPPTSVTSGQTAQFMATVANDSANAGASWSCMPVNSCGSFNPAKTASGAATTYTAPGSAGSVTIIATSVTDTTKTATATVTIAGALQGGLSINVSGPTSLAPSATGTFAATVSNDSSGKGVAWSCTPANSCGSFNPASGSGNTVTTTYTAPGTAPTGGVTIIATSQTDGKTNGTANVTIGSTSASLSLQAGTYVFYVVGEDNAKRTLGIAGAATLDGNGNVTGGEQDYNNADGIAGNNTPEQANADAFQSGGTYTVGSDGRGTLTVSVANTTEGASGKETFSITVVNSKHALITEFDGSATSSGSLDFQTPPPNGETSYSVQDIAGPYSFSVTGFTRLYAYSQGGVFTLCASAGAPNNGCVAAGDVVNSITDFNESDGSVTINTNVVKPNSATGVEDYPTAFAPGCATLNGGIALPGCGQAPDKFGRGTANYGGIFWSYYVVGPEVMRLLGCDGDVDGKGTGSGALDNLYIGSAYGQGTKSAGTFTTASLNGSYVIKDASVFPDSSLDGTTPANADVYFAAAGTLSAQNGVVSGLVDASSSSTASFTPAYNKGQAVANATFNVQSPTQGTGGNGILTLPAANTAGVNVIGVYFVDPNLNILDPNNTTSGLGGALVTNLDGTNLGAGVLIPQGTVSTPLQGNFAWLQQSFNASGEQDAVGQVVIATNNGISGKADVNDLLNTKQTPAATLTGNLTADPSHPGRFTVTITTSLGGGQTTYTLVLYQIGSLGYVDVQTDASQLGTGALQIQ